MKLFCICLLELILVMKSSNFIFEGFTPNLIQISKENLMKLKKFNDLLCMSFRPIDVM